MKKQILYYSFAIAIVLGVYSSASSVSAQIPGGYGDTSVTDKDAKRAANFAVKQHSHATGSKFTLVRIKKAEVQVVAGLNYRICMVVREGKRPVRTVTAVVYKNLKNKLSLTRWKSGGCTDL